MNRYFLLFSLFIFAACGGQTSNNTPTNPPNASPTAIEPVKTEPDKQIATQAETLKHQSTKTLEFDYDTTQWTELIQLDPTIRLDIKYATADNFVNEKMYNCARCFLRPEVAQAVLKAHRQLQEGRLGLKMFDCYRPRPIQQKLWDKVPNASYVTPPSRGSMHNRGAAVDLTIVDKDGKELEMGTAYDFFGKKAHQDFTDLPEEVLANRQLLKSTMASVGLKHIRTEWWHYSYPAKEYELSDMLWACEE